MTEQEPHVRIVLPRIPRWIVEMLRLELRKQRLAWIGLVAGFVLTLPMAILGARLGDLSVREAVDAVLMFWTVGGLPLAAVLLGASAGVGLRSEPAAGAEAALPLSTRRRAAAGLVSAGLYLALMAALVLGASLALSASWRATFFEKVWSEPEFLRAGLRLAGFILAELLLAAFVCSYLMAHGLAGGLLGAVIGGLAALCLVVGFGLQAFFHGEFPFPFTADGVVAGILCLLGGGLALALCADGVERRAGLSWGRGILIGALLASGPLAGAGLLHRRVLSFAHRPLLAKASSDFRMDEPSQRLARQLLPWLRKSELGGVLAENLSGEIFLLTRDGRRAVLREETEASAWRLLKDLAWRPVQDHSWDGEGNLWVITRANWRSDVPAELWRAAPGERLSRWSRVSSLDRFIFRGRTLGLRESAGPNFAPLPERGQSLQRRQESPFDDSLMKALQKEGLAEAPSRLERRWPVRKDESLGMYWVRAAMVKGEPWFLVPVRKGKMDFLLACLPGGKVQRAWAGPMEAVYAYDMRLLPDGSYWAARDRYSLHILTAEGEFLRPLLLWPALKSLPIGSGEPSGWPLVLRRDGDSLWLVAEERFLARVDMRTGRLERWWRLPDGGYARDFFWRVNQDGFFLDTGVRLYFMDWEGKAKKLI